MMRLQKFMASAGVASRRASEKLIAEGKVKVNGRPVTEMGTQINERKDIVHVQGKRIMLQEEKVYYMLNKPRGYVSTTSDEKGRKTVLDLVPDKERIYPVGRLDQNTSGIILLTNDGELTYGLTHPKHEVTKTYVVKVSPIPTKEQLSYLRKGGDIGPYTIGPCEISTRDTDTEAGTGTYVVIINEGKNHQVRNMFEYFKCEIVTLKRIAIGKLTLKGLRLGKMKELDDDEIKYLKSIAEIEADVIVANKVNKERRGNSRAIARKEAKEQDGTKNERVKSKKNFRPKRK